jgi:hypothetical protein
MRPSKFQKKLRKMKIEGEQYKCLKELEDTYSGYWPEHKKRKVSNIMLAVSTAFIVAYTICCLFIQYMTGIEVSPTLTTSVFAFFGSELLWLAGIKVTKVLKSTE